MAAVVIGVLVLASVGFCCYRRRKRRRSARKPEIYIDEDFEEVDEPITSEAEVVEQYPLSAYQPLPVKPAKDSSRAYHHFSSSVRKLIDR